MSLLMDALKKAELAKRQGAAAASEGAETPVEAGLALEPMGEAGSAAATSSADSAAGTGDRSALPPSHLEQLDAQFLAEAEQAAAARLRAPVSSTPVGLPPVEPPVAAVPPPRAKPEQDVPLERSAAQNLFAAKQADKPPARKTFALAVGALTVLAVCAVGGYIWWQLQPKSIVTVSRAPLSPRPVTVAPAPAASAPVAAAPAPTLAAVAPTAATGQPSATSPPAAAEREQGASASVKIETASRSRRFRAAPEAPAEPQSPIRLTRSPLKVNPALIRGFDAFNRGDLVLAQSEYERARKADPRNTDALHGLAAIALLQGRSDQADALYRQIIEADPQDTVAQSALINSRAQIDPGAAESRLKTLSAAQPDLAAPQFSLGNLYARQGRWNDAQQAYFRAYNAEPENPDILYNLAVSLEHLRQSKLAAQYYSLALAAAQTRPAGFDKALASARLQTLQR